MSKERELLEKILNTGWLNHELSCEVEAILAQPEQEAVEDRIARWHRLGYEQGKKASKREPLSDEEMRVIWKEGVRGEIPFVEIGRAIEKAHGITGVGNE